jgi:GDSL-like Lipase/Acylhydrolase family
MNSPDHTQQREGSGRTQTVRPFRGRLSNAWGRPIVAVIGIGCAIAAAAAAYAALLPPKEGLASDPRQIARIQVMQEHLATQTGPFIILAGDSHAERLGWDRVCGKPVVNLGLSGVTAIHYGKILSRLAPVSRADAMVVFLGTNDLSHKLQPGSGKSLKRFENRFGSVIEDSRRFAGRVVYAPLIPHDNDPRASAWLDTTKAAQYRGIASKVCLSRGCTPLDLDRIAVSVAEDGVHADRADRLVGGSLHALIEHELCPDHQSGASVFPANPTPAEGDIP